ncbi:MAG TPA: Dabb family protein [Candidatus Blautia faecavium]|uniref:Dabb family protein n=1 Tax=Candidatus Blautia faecavium TaxID=2838487 RepID=A0A9D2RUX7_9FIRM|nr:Dabb family protein [Candidatus Blautia faecavium]
MVKHIVMWSFKEEVEEAERKEAAAKIKEGLEGLVGVVPGLLKAEVVIDPISSSSHDLCLISELDTPDSLKAYATNPDHVKVATFVRSVTCNRACMDYEF